MKYEDFTDNEYLEKMIEELRANGTNVIMLLYTLKDGITG